MRELRLVGLSEDGDVLVLVDDTGQEFGLPADGRLWAALRGDRARLGQLEIEMDSAMRPRDIQARIRAGESPEAVAQLAHISVDKIMGFAVPVLAERAYVADRARRAPVRRKGGDGPARSLGEYVSERLASRGINARSAEWDAWRREDGRWVVSVDYRSGERERHATFVYDVPGRYVVTDNDDGRWLVGEQSPSHGPQPREAGHRRLSAVPSDREALPLDADTPYDSDDFDSTADLTEQVAELRSRGDTDLPQPESVAAPDDAAGADDMAAIADLISAPDVSPAEAVPAEPGSGEAAPVEPVTDEVASDAPPPGAAEEQPPRRSRQSRKDRRRASVPSWDEIMFGRGTSGEAGEDKG